MKGLSNAHKHCQEKALIENLYELPVYKLAGVDDIILPCHNGPPAGISLPLIVAIIVLGKSNNDQF